MRYAFNCNGNDNIMSMYSQWREKNESWFPKTVTCIFNDILVDTILCEGNKPLALAMQLFRPSTWNN